MLGVGLGGRGVQGLRALAAVAVDGDRLQALLPPFHVDAGDLLGRGVGRQVDGLGDRAGEEGLDGAHHPDVAHVVDRARAVQRPEGAVEDGQVLLLEAGRAFDRPLLVHVVHDRVDLGLGRSPGAGARAGRSG